MANHDGIGKFFLMCKTIYTFLCTQSSICVISLLSQFPIL